MVPSASAPIFWAGAALAVSALVTRASIAYAHRRNLIDVPGMRRSHTVPTPRRRDHRVRPDSIDCRRHRMAGTDRLLVARAGRRRHRAGRLDR
jgi:hypothetical protein